MAMLRACDRYGTTKGVKDVHIVITVRDGGDWEYDAMLCPRAVEALKKRIFLSTTPTPESKNGSDEV